MHILFKKMIKNSYYNKNFQIKSTTQFFYEHFEILPNTQKVCRVEIILRIKIINNYYFSCNRKVIHTN